MPLEGSHILLGVSGGISAYKACDLVRSLTKAGAEIQVVMTQSATQFVAPLTFEVLSKTKVHVDESCSECLSNQEIALARWADVLVIAPATASTLAKLAHGIADDMLGAIYLSFTGPVILAPSMNATVLEHPSTLQNLEILGLQNRHIIPPRSMDRNREAEGPPTMASLEDLMKAIAYSLGGAQDLEGRKFLITGGPTREHIDPVRFLTNPSSGRMGLALAEEARKRGARVTFVHGPLTDTPSRGVEAIPVTSVVEMFDRVMERLDECDVLISAAAPGDFVPEERQPQKIKKDASGTVTIKLKRAPDILAEAVSRRRPGQILVGFAAETELLVDGAKKKLRDKRLDIIVATEVVASTPGFPMDSVSESTKVIILSRSGAVEELEPQDNRRVVRLILDKVREQLETGQVVE